MISIDMSSHKKSNRFFIKLGEMDGFNWRSLKDFIAEGMGISSEFIKNIDVKRTFSFFEISSTDIEKILELSMEKSLIIVLSTLKKQMIPKKYNIKNAAHEKSFNIS